jgi:hypothetical protein
MNSIRDSWWHNKRAISGFLRGNKKKEGTNQLVRYEQDGLEGKLTIAQFEEVFERGAEQIDYHHVVVSLFARPDHPWHARSTHQRLVNLRLVLQWTRLFVDDRFELDGHFFTGHFVHSVENGSCTDTNQSRLEER